MIPIIRYLTAIAYEFFTAKSKGGVVLLAIYFYVTFVFSMLFWIDEGALVSPPSQDVNPFTGNNTLCGSLAGCSVVLTRLSLYDGTGAMCYIAIYTHVREHVQAPHKKKYQKTSKHACIRVTSITVLYLFRTLQT